MLLQFKNANSALCILKAGSTKELKVEIVMSGDFISPLPPVGVDHGELCELAEKLFKDLPATPSSPPTLAPCRYTGAEMRARNDDMPFAHIAMAVEVRKAVGRVCGLGCGLK